MSDLSEEEVTALRRWLRVTMALYSTEVIPRTVRRLPLSVMVLVHLWLQPDKSASYAELRSSYKIVDHSKLSHAIRPLIKRELAKRLGGFKGDRRMRGLRLLEQGRDVMSRLENELKGLRT